MNKVLLSFPVILLVFTPLVARCADNAVSPGPSLGDAKFTVHFAGILSDVIQALAKTTHRQIYLSSSPPPPGHPGTAKADIPVQLDFDNATLDTIMLSLCQQAGLVYQADWGPTIQLMDGDPTLDPRPTANLQDYVVRVTGAVVTSSRSLPMSWGKPIPDEPTVNDSLQISITVIPKSPTAELCLAGIEPTRKAITDKSGTLEPEAGPTPEGWYEPVSRFSSSRQWRPPMNVPALTFPIPPAGVRKLVRVEGGLRLFSEVKVTNIMIPAASEGQSFKQDDVSAVVNSWKAEGEDVTIALSVQAPDLPQKTPNQAHFGTGGTSCNGVLIGKDGRERYSGSSSTSSKAGEMKVQFRMNSNYELMLMPRDPNAASVPPFQPDHLLLTITRYGSADKHVPFVLENIPVP